MEVHAACVSGPANFSGKSEPENSGGCHGADRREPSSGGSDSRNPARSAGADNLPGARGSTKAAVTAATEDADTAEGAGVTAPLPDIEVARYALRTFHIDAHARALVPVVMKHDRHAWDGGVCVASCHRGHTPPADGCRCGVYGATSLCSLLEQYPRLAANIVAVIAAEGSTIIGNSGLRTQAARVVAYWCRPSRQLDKARAVLAEQCPSATPYDECGAMLAAYHLPVGLDEFGAKSWTGAVYTNTDAGEDATANDTVTTRLFRQLGYVVGLPVWGAAALACAAANPGVLPESAGNAVEASDLAVQSAITSGAAGAASLFVAVTAITLRIIAAVTNPPRRGHNASAPLGGLLRAVIGACVFFYLYAMAAQLPVPDTVGAAVITAMVGLAAPHAAAVAAMVRRSRPRRATSPNATPTHPVAPGPQGLPNPSS